MTSGVAGNLDRFYDCPRVRALKLTKYSWLHMYLIILGGGPEGASLINLALGEDHQVVLIESNEERARAVLQEHDITVLNGNIADDQILEEAGAAQADALIATTMDDSANLMAMVLGKEHGIKMLVTTVNQPHHQSMFEHLGAQVLANPENLAAQHLYHLAQQQPTEPEDSREQHRKRCSS